MTAPFVWRAKGTSMDSGENTSDSEFSDWDEYVCETDASLRQVRLRQTRSPSLRERRPPHLAALGATARASCANQVLASPSPATRIGDDSIPPAETLAVTSPATGTLCPRCQKQFPKLLSEYNLKEHQKSKTCQRKQTADTSSTPNLISGFNAPSPLPLSTTASADECKEPSRAAAPSSSRAAESKKRKSKKAGKAKTEENEKKAKQETRRLAEVEWTRAGLEDKGEARLEELRQDAKNDPSLLQAICAVDQACRDATCPWLHQCTAFGGRGKTSNPCKNQIRGGPSTSSITPGHNPHLITPADYGVWTV